MSDNAQYSVVEDSRNLLGSDARSAMVDTTLIPNAGSLIRGLPWAIGVFVFSFITWMFWEKFFQNFMSPSYAQMSSVGMGTLGAWTISMHPVFGYWPFGGISSRWVKGILSALFCFLVTAVFFILLGSVFQVNLQTWAFPIIGTVWFFTAALMFVGGNAHMQSIKEPRATTLNIFIIIGATLLVLATITWVPPFWFQYVQTLMVTGGLAYMLRGMKQPGVSFFGWAIAIGLTWITVVVAAALGHWELKAAGSPGWLWNIGQPSLEYQIFFAYACGFNFTFFAITKCWPFSRIRQPWGFWLALFSMLTWSLILTAITVSLFNSYYPDKAAAMWQASIFSWQTVVWGWVWVYSFGAGSQPYLWKGQKTPGTWDDVE